MIPESVSGYIISGALLGLTAGISPGPLLALVISETLRNNRYYGFRAAMAPLVADIPIIFLAFIVFLRLYHISALMGIISFTGSLFLAFLGIECMRAKGLNADTGKNRNGPMLKGIFINLLNPHPYLFWITVGTPLAIKAYDQGFGDAVVFFISFYIFLVGSKVLIAILVDKSKAFLSKRIYIWIMRILGICLFVFSVLFLLDGIKVLQS